MSRVKSMIQKHIDDVARGVLQIVIDSEFHLSEGADIKAHQHIEDRKAFGRVLLIP